MRASPACVVMAAATIILAGGHLGADNTGKDPLSTFTAEQRQKLIKGEPVYRSFAEDTEETMKGSGAAYIIIGAPIEKCMEIFLDFEAEHEYFPRMKISKVIRETDEGKVMYKVLDMRLIDVEYTHLMTVDEKEHRVSFHTIPGEPNTIDYSEGYFDFDRIDDGRTLFSYHLGKVDTGFYVPAFIRDYIQSKDLPDIAVNVKKRVESGGKWKEEGP